MGAVLLVAGLLLGACSAVPDEAAEAGGPAVVEPVDGATVARVTLTPEAVKRVDIQVARVQAASGTSLSIPYAAVFYTAEGDTWAYTNPEQGVYLREPIAVDRIDGDVALLTTGPPAGTAVVTQGAAELYGTETGVDE